MEYARLIRDNKDRDWKKYLNQEDLEIINGIVLPNCWYPLTAYEHAGHAIFSEIGQGKLENARVWGGFVIEDLCNRFYHHLVRFKDPAAAIERCRTFWSKWFQFDDPGFSAIEVEKVSPTEVKVKIRHDHPFDFFEAYSHQCAGTFARVAELNGGKEVSAEIVEHDWKKHQPYAVIKVNWKQS